MSSDNEQESSGFKVVDRRRFTVDGDLRDDAAEDSSSSTAEPAVTTPERPAPRPPEPAPAPEQRAQEAAPDEPDEDAPPADDDGAQPALNFTMFIQMLAQQCLMQLGMIPYPQGVRQLDLESARDTIDVLVLLKQKTAGNLDVEESRLLEGAMQELQMTYLEVARRVQAAGPGTGPGL